MIAAAMSSIAPAVSVMAPTPGAPAPLSVPGAGIGAELARLMASLAAVIALILVIAWLTRRLQQASIMRAGGPARRLRQLESLNIGLKERVVLVRVDHQDILLGSSPQGLRTLHVLPAVDPLAEPPTQAPAPVQGGFDAVLKRWMRPR